MTRPKINPKQDLREKTNLDSKMLKLAKEQEEKKHADQGSYQH